jgi:hypothetical protein
MMIVLGVAGGLLLLIAFLLSCSVSARVSYDGEFSLRVKYLFVTLFDSAKPPKKPKIKKAKQPKKPPKSKKQPMPTSGGGKPAEGGVGAALGCFVDDVKAANKRSFDFEAAKLIYDAAKSPVQSLIGKTRVEGLRLSCVIGGDCAATVAITYGLQAAAVSAGLEWLRGITRLRVKKVTVTADFSREDTEIRMRCRVRIRVFTALVCLLKYVRNTNKEK